MERVQRSARLIGVIGLATFSYSLVGLAGGSGLGVGWHTTLWTVVAVVGFVGLLRVDGRSTAMLWTPPRAWRPRAWLCIGAAIVVTTAAWPPEGHGHAEIIRIVVIGVVGEEVVFRGIVWDTVRRLVGSEGPGVWVTTTVLFALAHVQYGDFVVDATTAGQVGYTLVAGAALAAMRERSGSLITPIVAHATGNAVLKLIAGMG